MKKWFLLYNLLIVVGLWSCKGSAASSSSNITEAQSTQTQQPETNTNTDENKASSTQETKDALKLAPLDKSNVHSIPVNKLPKSTN